MKTYGNWSPTPSDTRGLNLPDRQTWLVLSVMQTRDSGPLSRSNFAAALKMLGGESETVEVHRFGHWGPGWFEIILVCPGTDAQAIGERIESKLADYPILDDDAHSALEWEEKCEAWANMDRRERIAICAKHRVSIFAARRDEIPQGLPYEDDFYTPND